MMSLCFTYLTQNGRFCQSGYYDFFSSFKNRIFGKLKEKRKFFYQKTKTSTIILTKNEILNAVFSKKSDTKGPKFGDFWRFSKILTSIANYKIYSKFFHVFKNQNLGHL